MLYILALLKRKYVNKADIVPYVTLIIPAYNEEAIIKNKIENTLLLDYPREKLQILIASDGSTDKTVDFAAEYINEGVELLDFKERKGKSSLYYRAMPKAKGEIIVFSDADAVLVKDSIRNIVKSFNDKRIGCVEGVRRDEDPDGVPADSIYWKYETFIKKQASMRFSALGATGALFAIRKE